MAHKVHPKAFRIKKTTDWSSRWLTKRDFPKFLEEDFRIKEFLNQRLKIAGLEKIEIERSPGKINIFISCVRPGLIIGRGGGGIEELKKNLERKVLKQPSSTKNTDSKQGLRLEVIEVKNPWISSSLISQWIAQQLEKRLPHRRVLKQALDKIMVNKEIQGARVEVAGRLDGKDIARRAWLKKGRLPRQTLRADIDYGTAGAYCAYGVVGVKVWLYKGESFEK
jgi:small subunit ribosomal protein S3